MTGQGHLPDEQEAGEQRAAEPFMAIALAAVGIVLLAQLGQETKPTNAASFVLEPAFMPGLALFGVALFALWRLAVAGRSGVGEALRLAPRELGALLRASEFLLWFLAYVSLVPWTGYLAATVAFCIALSLRAGYRSHRSLVIAVVFAVAVVLFFKAFLQVKIPGGAVYEYLPNGLRNFMISNF